MYQPSGVYILEGRNSGKADKWKKPKTVTEGVGLKEVMKVLTEDGQCERDVGKTLPYFGAG